MVDVARKGPLSPVIAAIAVLGMIVAPVVLTYLSISERGIGMGLMPTDEEAAAGKAFLLAAGIVALTSAISVWVLTVVRATSGAYAHHGWEIVWCILALPTALVGFALAAIASHMP
ncbi:hypothetical protein [Rathayibacter sp. AY1A5]|uniref:hypothetical protein n=1 Tax=Rathayibacter sp. AY1A5 TaxID=2080523 RepID=UPI0015E43A30|nr:hypothetical protein [Rathayibacter sp. AY1A5]